MPNFETVVIDTDLLIIGGGMSACGAAFEAAYWAKKNNLKVTVVEGGNLQSLKSVQITSQVEGQAKIISIVPEGTLVTPEDVAAGKVLVELDSSDLRDRLNRQELSVADATSAVTQGQAAK